MSKRKDTYLLIFNDFFRIECGLEGFPTVPTRSGGGNFWKFFHYEEEQVDFETDSTGDLDELILGMCAGSSSVDFLGIFFACFFFSGVNRDFDES